MVLVAGALLPLNLTAQSSAPAGRRYLFIVETSRAMEHRKDGLEQALQQLLDSGLHGELRRGDTLGIWTFNDALHTGQFPLKPWTADSQPEIANSARSFVKSQKFEKAARWDNVLPALNHVVQASPMLTVVLFTAETASIQGTAFDAPINEAFKTWRIPQDVAHLPIITVLRAGSGKLTAFAVSAPPWPVEFPLLPPEPKLAVQTPPLQLQPVAKPQAPRTPPRLAAPLIISGKRPESSEPTVVLLPSPQNQDPPAPASTNPTANPRPVGLNSSSPLSTVETNMARSTSPAPPATAPRAEPAAALSQQLPAPATAQASVQAAGSPGAPVSSTPPNAEAKQPSEEFVVPAGDGKATTRATVSGTRSGLGFWFAVAGGCLGITTAAFFLVLKRSRSPAHISLITRSLERQVAESKGR